jgi:CHAD domain-containing protein
MMTPKIPKNNAKKSTEGFERPDAMAAVKPRAKKPVAKDMAASPHIAAQKAVTRVPAPVPLLVGDYAHGLIQQHFERMFRDRAKVLDDQAPTALHQMRAHGRRLQTTIDLFSTALKIPKQGQIKQLKRFHRTLGTLRNLDVVTAWLQPDDAPELAESEQLVLDRCGKKLIKRRQRSVADVQAAIATQTLEVAYSAWLKQPEYQQFAAQPLTHVLPQLLLPDLTAFLAAPGWAIAAADMPLALPVALHDLRKAVKQQRDQLEAVSPILGAAVADWIVDLKALQDCLGTLQDLVVLQEMVPAAIALPTLMARLAAQQQVALAQWDQLRQPYLQPQFHYQCYASILQVLMVSE